MKKDILLLAALSMGMAACTNETLNPDDSANNNATDQDSPVSNLTTAKLAVFSGNPNRVTYEGNTRAEEELQPGELRLVATIGNPDASVFSNFTGDGVSGGRYMSATSVYYNEDTQTYYVTYHMQGNNYNTNVDVQSAGAIQSFKIAEDGTVELGDGFTSANRNEEDFDFNHIYFEKTDQRILAVGHNVKGGKQDNTNAIVGIFDPTTATYTYSTVKTNEKDYDEAGKSLGYKDAGDVNSILRPNDDFLTPSGWNFYLLATRKGLAVVRADEGHLFEPVLNEDGENYFIPTPGSAKSIIQGTAGSYFGLLYLSQNTAELPEAYSTGSEAKIAHFAINTTSSQGLRSLMYPTTAPFTSPFIDFDPREVLIENFSGQTDIPGVISPIDGKNTLFAIPRFSDEEYYAALGTSGLYYHFRGNTTNRVFEGVKKYGNRPVNNVFADREVTGEGIYDEEGHRTGHDGFLYVANGSKITVHHRHTMEELASWNMPSKDADGNDIASSANFITVTSAPVGENGLSERTIAVAFGQAGVKIFKFMPATKTVWEREVE